MSDVQDNAPPQSNVHELFPAPMLQDLAKSGLHPSDLKVKPLSPVEKQAANVPYGAEGYVIPYFDPNGVALPFYRVKLYEETLNDDDPKYKQPLDNPNHIYFPPGLLACIRKRIKDGTFNFLILTEGEKKAAKAVKEGFPCVAVGGVDSWRTRTLILPKDSALAQSKGGKEIKVKLPSTATPAREATDTLATGMNAVIDLVLQQKINLVIVYDSDSSTNPDVQRAAATLGFELRLRGIPATQIRQLHLPPDPDYDDVKVGLDDYLVGRDDASTELDKLIQATLSARTAFPRHPNIRDFVTRKLQRSNLTRNEMMGVAFAVLADLDAKGLRLRAPDEEQGYYFDQKSKTLTRVSIHARPDFPESPFGIRLYKDYGLGLNDQRCLTWIASLFAGEEPITVVHPERVLTWRGDTLYYQVNDGTTARVTKDRIDLIDNGEDNILFESGMVEHIPESAFLHALHSQESDQEEAGTQSMQNWWYPVIQQARMKDTHGDNQRRLLSLLYYVSPFFYRWRGTQLPVEITTGEAGSGKSTLYQLRLSILTGMPILRNAPSDLRDWNSGLSRTGGLHVTDNVQLANNDLRQRLSDEICRLVTEPNPSVNQRKLYTDTTEIRIPVKCVFAVTAIRQPFQNVDIIQRSIITELDKGTSSDLTYDARWHDRQLANRGGRVEWLVHSLRFVQQMLRVIHLGWDRDYKAKYRLINVEQLLMVAAKSCGWEHEWLPSYMEQARDKKVSENDWTLEGLTAFAMWAKREYPRNWSSAKTPVSRVSEWASGQEEYEQCNMITNTRSLQRYLTLHKHVVATTAGLVIQGEGPAMVVQVVSTPTNSPEQE